MFLADSYRVRPPRPIEKNCPTGERGSQAIIPVGLAMFRLRDLLWHKNYQFPHGPGTRDVILHKELCAKRDDDS